MRVFCLDTNAFIEPWVRRYPIDVFPSYWQKLDEWTRAGSIVAPDEVLREIEKSDDELHKWAKARAGMFQPPEEAVQQAVSAVLSQFPRLVDTKKGRSAADPWVIAQAQVMSATVVTEEAEFGGRSPRIPDVCRAMGIPFIRVIELIREMKLKV